MSLQIEHREVDSGVVVVTLTGRVMLGESSTDIETLVKRLIGEGKNRVVFELSGVTHIDSTGIGRFISSLNKLRQAGGGLRMAGATGQVRDAFHVTRLDTIFNFDDDVESALKALG
jgi:anti-sigma B factor antagonist